MPKEILIVDDEPSIVVPIQFLMEQQGYNVLVAQNGEDALDVIYKYKPDLILLDIMLPRIDGYEVCERLKEKTNGKVKIVLYTAYAELVDIKRAKEAGADEFISKTEDFSNMLNILKKIGKR